MLSVEEFAKRAGISPRAVRFRIAEGTLRAEKVGGYWVVDYPDASTRRRPGRRLGVRSFDLLADYLDGDREELTSDQRRRAKERAQQIHKHGIPQVRLYAERPEIVVARFHAADDDLAELRNDPRLVPTGVSHPDAEVYGPVVDAYVSSGDRGEIELFHLLESEVPSVCNVTLRMQDPPPTVRRLHVVADLLDDHNPRSRAEASRLLGVVLKDAA